MKTKYKWAIIIAITFNGCSSNEKNSTSNNGSVIDTQISSQVKMYEEPSGIIEYKETATGMASISGNKTLYFKNWGNLTLNESKITTKIMGQTESEEKKEKYENGIGYSINDKDKIIIKTDLNGVVEAFGSGKNSMANTGKEMIEKMGGKKTGIDKVLGYECEIWQAGMQGNGIKTCIYKGIPLKTTAEMGGMINEEVAVKIEFDVDIPDDKFALPNYPIKTLEEMMPSSN